MARATEPQRDHVDRFLESIREELPDLDLTVEGIVDRINGLSRRIKRLMDETLTERDMTWGEWKVLGLLRRSPEHRRSPGYLAVHAELSSGAMTNRLDNLERRGLLRRVDDPDDRRGVFVELTDDGNKLWEKAVGVQAEKEAIVDAALGQRQKQELNDLLRKLINAFGEEHGPLFKKHEPA